MRSLSSLFCAALLIGISSQAAATPPGPPADPASCIVATSELAQGILRSPIKTSSEQSSVKTTFSYNSKVCYKPVWFTYCSASTQCDFGQGFETLSSSSSTVTISFTGPAKVYHVGYQ